MTDPSRSWRTWLTRPGGRAIEAIAQLNQLVAQRRTGNTIAAPLCCDLARSPESGCYTRCINHGSGYWIQYWWCCHGGYRYQCQECTTENTCWTTNVICSNIVQGPSC